MVVGGPVALPTGLEPSLWCREAAGEVHATDTPVVELLDGGDGRPPLGIAYEGSLEAGETLRLRPGLQLLARARRRPASSPFPGRRDHGRRPRPPTDARGWRRSTPSKERCDASTASTPPLWCQASFKQRASFKRLLFRRVLYLSFALRGPAERIVFDDSATVLQGWFEPLDFAVSDAFETLLPAALTASEEGAVLVRPEGPGELRRVELTDSLGAGHVLDLHRLVDGVLEEEAAASGEVVAGVAELTTEPPEEGFGLRLRAGATPVPVDPANVVALVGEPHRAGFVEQRGEEGSW